MKIAVSRYRRLLSLFQFGTELLGKIPSRNDGPLEVVAKLLAIAGVAEKVFGRSRSKYDDIFSRHDLRERRSEPFVRLFFDTEMSAGFTMRRHALSDHLELIEAIAPDDERVFFLEYRYGRPEVSAEFFHTPGFDFAAALSGLWASFPDGIFITLKAGRHSGNEVAFCRVPAPHHEALSRKGAQRIVDGVKAHGRHDGEPYCFIAYGAPGTGKTGYVLGIAKRLNARLLMVDASALGQLGITEVSFLLDALQPRFLLIDDFDAAPLDEARARLRFLFRYLHEAHRELTLAVTVNDPSKLDEALLRSERIDEAEEFVLPDAPERKEILARYITLHDGGIPDADLEALVSSTEGFSQADLGGLARKARRSSFAEALVAMNRLRGLAARAREGSASSNPATKPE